MKGACDGKRTPDIRDNDHEINNGLQSVPSIVRENVPVDGAQSTFGLMPADQLEALKSRLKLAYVKIEALRSAPDTWVTK